MGTAFPERLRSTRDSIGESQDEFSKRIGVSRASLSYYENGTRTPDVDVLKRIYETTGVSIYYLLGLSDSRDDALAAAQKDTGLSEKALKHFSSHPLSVKVINYLVDCGSLFSITGRAAILHDDVRWLKRNPPKEWSAIMQAMRDDHFKEVEKEMTAGLVAMLLEGNMDDELFNVPSNQLPTFAVQSTLQRLRYMRDRFQLLDDPESKKLADQYTQTIDAILNAKEAPNAPQTPEQ